MDSTMITTVALASVILSFGILKKQQAGGRNAAATQIFRSFCLGIGTACGGAVMIFSVLFFSRPVTDYVGLAGLGIFSLGLYLVNSLPARKE